MNTSPATNRAQRLLQESGLTSSHEPIDVMLVSAFLQEHYHLTGRLGRLATEKDDTFRLSTDSRKYLVKVSPPDEAEAVVHLQTAALRYLESTAPHLPVQRVKLTADGEDHVTIRVNDGRPRVLRVFDFVEGQILALASPDVERLAKAGEMLGRVDVALRTFTHPADRRGLAWDLRHFHQLTELVEHTPNPEHRRLAESVFRLFGENVVPRLSDLEAQVIHGDFSPYNIVVDPEKSEHFITGVIDFGDTVRSAVIFDPAVPMANLLARTPDHPWRDACAFAAGYQRTRPIKDSELPLLPVAALARLTLRALLTNWRAERAPERREYLLGHAKDDWINVERALAVSLDDVIARLRSRIVSNASS
ncbi:phosphotransferase [Streptomyces stelliscabiei]|uniref:phosphotransferase n=1 Tax=Streptomyces stelliscabiei TaxID=146820 RepID=UPI0029AEFBEE|nr:phosphotransferase [Streptomyces stelliscabiei]MDX2521223.1 phosphotransferase [Streptomyces stelliscabiei]